MQDDIVYRLSPKGEAELRGGSTTLAPDELDLLVRIDGTLSLEQIRAAVPGIGAQAFTSSLSRLLSMGLLSVVQFDPFATQFNFRPNLAEYTQDQADSGIQSLKRAGYFVSIARKRNNMRSLAAGQAPTAVIVDDDPMLAKFIQTYMALEGFQTRIAGNRAEVIAALRAQPIADLVLLDVMLPDADGFDILMRMRQHPMLKDVPVIMLTGKATREDVIKGLGGGADGYVTKPFEAEVLMNAVRTVLGIGNLPDAGKKGADPWGEKTF